MPAPKAQEGDDPDPTPYLFVSLEQKRIDQTKPYDAKKACWVPDEKEGYLLSEIKATKGDVVSVGLPGGETKQYRKDQLSQVNPPKFEKAEDMADLTYLNEASVLHNLKQRYYAKLIYTKDFKKDQLQQVNPPKYEKCEDMSNLTYLNDASVLHNLKQRYYAKLIYTYSGLFCVAINPYKRFPVYTSRCAKLYRGKRRSEVPPHIFAISDGAYVNMLTNNENQSMLITGESGAGKTENTKKVIAYFATVGASTKKDKEVDTKKGSLEDQVVQTNPVLEAFGNAKTVRNDNSSRFGKFIRIHFGPSGKLAGADIETYLLEKARVISQQTLERSYHIFYQMMSGSVKGLKEICLLSNNVNDYYFVSQGKTTIPNVDDGEECLLTDRTRGLARVHRSPVDTTPLEMCLLSNNITDYYFVSQGKTTIPGLDDGEELLVTDVKFRESTIAQPWIQRTNKLKQNLKLQQAFDVLGFTQEEKDDIYKITAAVMHMGGMKFKQRGREEQAEADGTEEGDRVAKLLGCDCADLYKNLLKPRIKVGNEFVTQGRNKDQVAYSVGAMSKAMFDRLFKWLVKKCNETLDTKQKRQHFIGVLDIAGFEIFDFNGFEQLCINFTNEKLQQFFNHHMFVLEQEEYKKEGIVWQFIDFGMDLLACIELIEKKSLKRNRTKDLRKLKSVKREFNSFEQLCINFTNEKLQQFFNHHMFVLEQEEYTREGIEWAFIDFGMDLVACIDLIEKFNGFEQLCINFTNEKLQQFFNHHMFVLEQEEYKKEGIDWVFIDFGMDLLACIELIEKFNSFEQLCINFTNEKLQQFFNHHMFILEQEEYKREGIEWTFIDFGMDLQQTIDLIEKPTDRKIKGPTDWTWMVSYQSRPVFFTVFSLSFSLALSSFSLCLFAVCLCASWCMNPMGILSILEEESMFPKATDKTFEEKLNNNHLGKSPNYLKPKPPKPGQQAAHFAIGHYAGNVPYNITGWLEKNKDPLNDTVVDQFKKSSNKLLVEIFADHPGQSGDAGGGGGAKGGRGKKGGGFSTVSSSYKEQLNNLMTTLRATQPHFVRCIIPNELKQPGVIDSHLVMHQLTCNGVLEGIRICRKGFPNRMVYPDFKLRYMILAPAAMAAQSEPKVAAAKCFEEIALDPDRYKILAPAAVDKAKEPKDAAAAILDSTGLDADTYKILCANAVQEPCEPQKATQIILDSINLESDQYRMGHTKVSDTYCVFEQSLINFKNICLNDESINSKIEAGIDFKTQNFRESGVLEYSVFFRAGVLGQMEELRDERLSKIVSWMQAYIRGYLSRKDYKKLQEQRLALVVVQRNLRKYLQLRTWPWWKLWQKIKPLLNVTRIEDEMANPIPLVNGGKIEGEMASLQALEEKARKAQEAFEKEEKLRKELEDMNSKLLTEKTNLLRQLEGEKGSLSEYQEKSLKLAAQKADLESQLQDLTDRFKEEEDARNNLFQNKKKLEQEVSGLKKDIEDLELNLQKSEQDKATKDHQIRNLNDEIAHQDELINKLNKEKKNQGEVNQKTGEELQAAEDKVNHLNKVKLKLEQTLDELEDSLEREKKSRADVEKAKRKVEGDLKLTQEAVADLERNKKELEQTIQRKDKELSSLTAKLEDEQSLVGKLQKQIKELQARIEELEEEIEAERGGRAKAEKQRSDLARELEELGERLEEAGGATSAQIELNKKREAELSKLRRDLEEANIQHESSLAILRKKHNDAVAEMGEQIDTLNKLKARVEKEKVQYYSECNDLRTSCDHLSNEKAAQEKIVKQLQHQLNETQGKLEEVNRTLNDFDAAKKKLSIENSDLLRQLEEAESQVSQLSKIKISLTTQLEDTKRLADEESRERATLLGKFRNLEHDLDNIREQVEEEAEGKADLQRQLSKANAEAQLWRTKYESEGVARAEELEEAKRKLQARLAEAEETIESLNQKVIALEKTKQRLSTEVEDLQIEVDRATAIANAAEKKQKAFDKIIGEWKLKVDDLAAELDASQKECRNYSTELFRLRGAYEEGQEQLEAVRRENKNLADEVKDLLDQIGEGGRNIHEIEKARKRLEAEKDELQAALEEAEAALEQEENKVLRSQLELSQVRQEIDRRIQEKEEEFENTRKNHQRALDSMQASLEAEAKGKAEALRMKKKLEADINELEIALDHANKANAEAQKNIKRYQQQLKDVQTALEEEQRARDEARELLGISERRANALQNELEESRTLLEQADRGRRQAEQELADCHEQLNELSAQNASISGAKRKLEAELQTLHSDLDELLNEAKNSEEKAKKAMVDAARLADELRAEQDHAQTQEKLRKALETQIKELQVRLDEAEANALKGGKKAIQKLEQRVRELENELDGEQRRHADAQKNLRKSERRIKELSFQADEDRKNHERMQDLVDKLQQKIKTYKRQIEEAEEIAALNLAKFRKAQQELEEAEERADLAEQAITKFRTKGRGGSAARGLSPAVSC
ncbi:Myosin heavy chain, muscle [Trachymyrmex zeteki]|uniref:Myosin heavy chain, muscle n=3 Tax=Apocrita TaxID=7400 RepID=A0A151XJ25_9HYME|nr:Myosin heavy chain, muscle [Trachymyrmex zeteki]